MACYRIFKSVVFTSQFLALSCWGYSVPYSIESLREEIQHSRSNPLDYIESNRKRDYAGQYPPQSLGVGFHKIEQCKKGDVSCKRQVVVNLDLKCSTNESQEYFDVLVPFRFKKVDIDISDKSLNGINGQFPMMLQSGANGELHFAIDDLGKENLKFILRRNKKEIILSEADASKSIVLPTGFCAN